MSDREANSRKEYQDLRKRTKQFGLRVVRMYVQLPKTTEAQVLGKQVLRSGTSVGAQYREAYRARSKAEYISKLGGSQQELEETTYWFELLVEAGIVSEHKLSELHAEANELMAIYVTTLRKLRNR